VRHRLLLRWRLKSRRRHSPRLERLLQDEVERQRHMLITPWRDEFIVPRRAHVKHDISFGCHVGKVTTDKSRSIEK